MIAIHPQRLLDTERDLLHELVRPPEPPGLLWVLLGRDEATGTITLPGELRRLHLAPLGVEAARLLAQQLLPEEAAGAEPIEAIVRETEGHPLYIHELARYVHELGPSAPPTLRLQSTISRRVQRLDRDAYRALEVLCVAAEPLGEELLVDVAGLSVAVLARALSELGPRRLIRASGRIESGARQLEPYHDHVRQAILADLDDERERAIHRALAHALQSLDDPPLLRLLGHLRSGGLDDERQRVAELAADEAITAFAYDRAIALYREALELADPGDEPRLRAALARALQRAGHLHESAQHWGTLAERATGQDRTVALERHEDVKARRLECLAEQAQALLFCWEVDDGQRILRRALAEAGIAWPKGVLQTVLTIGWTHLRLRLRGLAASATSAPSAVDRATSRLLLLAHRGMLTTDPLRACSFVEQGLLRALERGDRREIALFSVFDYAMWDFIGGAVEGRWMARLRTVVEAYLEEDDDAFVRNVLSLSTGPSPLRFGVYEHEQIEEHFNALEASVLQTWGGGLAVALVRIMWLTLLVRAGSWAKARQDAASFIADARRRHDDFAEFFIVLNSCPLQLMSDDVGAARAELDRLWSRILELPPQVLHSNVAPLTTAYLTLDAYEGVTGSHQELRAMLTRYRHTWAGIPWYRVPLRFYLARRELSSIDAEPGRRRRAMRRARALARSLAREGIPDATIFSHALRARLALAQSGRHAAIEHLERARTIAEQTKLGFWEAAAALRLGELRDDEHGHELVARATRWMQEQGIANPQRMANLLLRLA